MAKAKISRMERLFNYFKKNPGKPVSDAAKVLKMTSSSSSSLVSQMENRGILKSEKKVGPDAKGVERSMKFYTVAIPAYELLPEPAQAKPAAAAKKAVAKKVQAAAPAEQVLPAGADSLIDNMTVRQARALYAKLHQLFGT